MRHSVHTFAATCDQCFAVERFETFYVGRDFRDAKPALPEGWVHSDPDTYVAQQLCPKCAATWVPFSRSKS